MNSSADKFQVDLAGIIRLLGDSLYSGPHVVIRELCQNGLDAVTQRGDDVDERPAVQLVTTSDPEPTLYCLDSGIGLTPADISEFLATVGRSSKRREDQPLAELVGQFGIGLLSAFLIGDQIDLFSQVSSGETVSWVGKSDGTFVTREAHSLDQWCDECGVGQAADDLRSWFASGCGTVLKIVPKPHHQQWVKADTVKLHAERALSGVQQRIQLVADGGEVTNIAPTPQPWDLPADELHTWAEDFLSGPVLDTMPLNIPALGLRGMAAIPASQVPPSVQPQHVARVKGVTVDSACSALLPPWAFFVKVLVDSSHLNPTTSRESVRDDEQLDTVRGELSRQILSWVVRLSRDDRTKTQFLRQHSTGLMGVCMTCDEETLLRLMGVVEYETTLGHATLPRLIESHEAVYVASTVDEFRQVAAVASQVGVCVVNGGYTFAQESALRGAQFLPQGERVSLLEPDQLRADLLDPHPDDQQAIAELVRNTPHALSGPDVELVGKVFAPNSVAALLLKSTQSQRDDHRLQLEDEAEDEFTALLKQTAPKVKSRPQLVINTSNAAVQDLLRLRSESTIASALLQSIYARALLHGQHPVSPADARLIDRSMSVLFQLASSNADATRDTTTDGLDAQDGPGAHDDLGAHDGLGESGGE